MFKGSGGLLSPSSQFIELIGIQYIGLGAVVDELTPKERVYDTLEQLTTRTERLITIGYLVDEEEKQQDCAKSYTHIGHKHGSCGKHFVVL